MIEIVQDRRNENCMHAGIALLKFKWCESVPLFWHFGEYNLGVDIVGKSVKGCPTHQHKQQMPMQIQLRQKKTRKRITMTMSRRPSLHSTPSGKHTNIFLKDCKWGTQKETLFFNAKSECHAESCNLKSF